MVRRATLSESSAEAASDWNLLFAAWLIATVSALGSLFFSYVLDYAPCVLCWYQRICLFPLVLLLGRGLFPLDRSAAKFALPLAAAGWLLAAYHNLLFVGVIPAAMQPCTQGVSCTETYISWFGFVSIPLLALLSFSAITGILIALNRRNSA